MCCRQWLSRSKLLLTDRFSFPESHRCGSGLWLAGTRTNRRVVGQKFRADSRDDFILTQQSFITSKGRFVFQGHLFFSRNVTQLFVLSLPHLYFSLKLAKNIRKQKTEHRKELTFIRFLHFCFFSIFRFQFSYRFKTYWSETNIKKTAVNPEIYVNRVFTFSNLHKTSGVKLFPGSSSKNKQAFDVFFTTEQIMIGGNSAEGETILPTVMRRHKAAVWTSCFSAVKFAAWKSESN